MDEEVEQNEQSGNFWARAKGSIFHDFMRTSFMNGS